MTINETVQIIDAINCDDAVAAHRDCDDVLLRFLRSNGYGEICDAWDKIEDKCHGFWYC